LITFIKKCKFQLTSSDIVIILKKYNKKDNKLNVIFFIK